MYPIPSWLYSKIKRLAIKQNVSPFEICRVIGIPSAMLRLTEWDMDDCLDTSNQNKIDDDLASRIKLIEELFGGTTLFSDLKAEINNVICNELKKQIAFPTDNVLFAWLDILGFKEIVKGQEADVKSFLNGLLNLCEINLDKCRNIAGCKIDYSYDLNFRIFSDTIFIWTNSIHYRLFYYFFLGLNSIIRESLKIGILLRGIVTLGNVFTIKQQSNLFFSNEAVYGNALTNAYLWENQFEWAGCVVAPAVIQMMNHETKTFKHCSCENNIIKHFFGCEPLLIWTDLPHKSNTIRGAALNWCYPGQNDEDLHEEDIINAFGKDVKSQKSLAKKMENTLRFFRNSHHANTGTLFVPDSSSISEYSISFACCDRDFQAKSTHNSSSRDEKSDLTTC